MGYAETYSSNDIIVEEAVVCQEDFQTPILESSPVQAWECELLRPCRVCVVSRGCLQCGEVILCWQNATDWVKYMD